MIKYGIYFLINRFLIASVGRILRGHTVRSEWIIKLSKTSLEVNVQGKSGRSSQAFRNPTLILYYSDPQGSFSLLAGEALARASFLTL